MIVPRRLLRQHFLALFFYCTSTASAWWSCLEAERFTMRAGGKRWAIHSAGCWREESWGRTPDDNLVSFLVLGEYFSSFAKVLMKFKQGSWALSLWQRCRELCLGMCFLHRTTCCSLQSWQEWSLALAVYPAHSMALSPNLQVLASCLTLLFYLLAYQSLTYKLWIRVDSA